MDSRHPDSSAWSHRRKSAGHGPDMAFGEVSSDVLDDSRTSRQVLVELAQLADNFRVHRHNRQTQRRLTRAYRRLVIHARRERLNACLGLRLRRVVVLFRLGRVLAFLLLFFLQ